MKTDRKVYSVLSSIEKVAIKMTKFISTVITLLAVLSLSFVNHAYAKSEKKAKKEANIARQESEKARYEADKAKYEAKKAEQDTRKIKAEKKKEKLK